MKLFDKPKYAPIAFVLCVLLLLTVAIVAQPKTQLPSTHHNATQSEAYCPYEEYETKLEIAKFIIFKHSCKNAQDANHSNNDKESFGQISVDAAQADLLAQRSMAHWALWVTVFTAIGLCALIWTIYETLKAGKELRSQNDLARKTARAEYQPYIEVSDVSMPQTSQTVENIVRHLEHVCRFSFKIKNTGKTPALVIAKSVAARLKIATQTDHEYGFSAETIPFVSRQRGLILPQLNADGTHIVEISIPISVKKEKLEGITITGPNILIDVGIRLSFDDEFLEKGHRRVIALVFEIINNTITLKTFFSGIGGKADDPHEWNKNEGKMLPHAFYGNDILGEIK